MLLSREAETSATHVTLVSASRLNSYYSAVIFNPRIPSRMIAAKSNRGPLADSPNNTIPKVTAPKAPIPVQMA